MVVFNLVAHAGARCSKDASPLWTPQRKFAIFNLPENGPIWNPLPPTGVVLVGSLEFRLNFALRSVGLLLRKKAATNAIEGTWFFLEEL